LKIRADISYVGVHHSISNVQESQLAVIELYLFLFSLILLILPPVILGVNIIVSNYTQKYNEEYMF
jgi:hypothetical protein